MYKGWCTNCQKWHEAPVDFSEQVLGQGRIGVRLASMIAYLRTVMRLPLRQLRDVLRDFHGFEVSLGELVELLHRISEHAQPVLTTLKAEIRASPAVQADETGWREDGINGYIWSVSTPQMRYYEYHHSRSGAVVKQLIGDDFPGVLGSDFYAGYNSHQGWHQRCWVHYLRDVNNLAERSVRPLVIARKISGGTRSPKGSQTRMGLASLFGTWMAQGLNPFHQCLALLSSTTSLC